jgi:glucose/arabinose dehydrogenase
MTRRAATRRDHAGWWITRRVPSATCGGLLLATALVSAACASDGNAANYAEDTASVSAVLTPIAAPEAVGVPVDLAFRTAQERPYAVDKAGRIVRLDAEPVVVLDIVDLVSTGNEQGLLGLVFAADGSVAYVNYTDTDGTTTIAEFVVGADGGFDRDSMRVVLSIAKPHDNHNGGDLALGPEGLLYIGTGDGGGGGDPDRRALDMGDLLGKMLRIDPATPSDAGEYTIPSDNPFAEEGGVRGEIWSYGLRNPWRFSFDPVTFDLWIADVGQDDVEEVSVAPAVDGRDAGRGVNFGWSAFEGNERYNEDQSAPNHHEPIYTYDHDRDCSISGGVRARGEGAGRFDGMYVYGELCSGAIVALPVTGEGADLAVGSPEVVATVQQPTAVTAGPDGTIYVLSRDGVSTISD